MEKLCRIVSDKYSLRDYLVGKGSAFCERKYGYYN